MSTRILIAYTNAGGGHLSASLALQEALRGAYGNAGSITADELSTYLHFLASDQLEGRNTPSRGYDTASLYIASQLKQWGVKPLGSTTGTKGPLQAYFMPLELVSNQLNAAGMKLTLSSPAVAGRGGFGGAAQAGPRSFEFGSEWALGGGGFGGGGRGGGASTDPIEIAGAQLVFAGNGYVINKTNIDPYKGLDVKGKILVVAGVPARVVRTIDGTGPTEPRSWFPATMTQG